MKDTELYRHLLGIKAPWDVTRVELNVSDERVDVWVDHGGDEQWECPECGTKLGLYDHVPERAWRHLDSCRFKTLLHARPPRVRCPQHGVKQVKLPWAEPRSRFTAMFERLAIDVLLETDILGATKILRISWDEAWHLLDRAVERGLATKKKRISRHIGVDEKAAAKGHKYLTLVCDLERSTVEYIGEDRKWESLDGYFAGLTTEQLEGIEAVATDMWDPYLKTIRERLPKSEEKVVFDRYHIMRNVGAAVDHVRRREHRELSICGDETLKGTKYLWLYSEENVPAQHQPRFGELKARNLKTARAWALKESLRGLWDHRRAEDAGTYWKWWYNWATHSQLRPMVEAARTIKRHLSNVLTYFAHRITNAVAEGLNSKIQTIKKMAYGFRNKEHFRTAIFFHCGGLSLYPATHTEA